MMALSKTMQLLSRGDSSLLVHCAENCRHWDCYCLINQFNFLFAGLSLRLQEHCPHSLNTGEWKTKQVPSDRHSIHAVCRQGVFEQVSVCDDRLGRLELNHSRRLHWQHCPTVPFFLVPNHRLPNSEVSFIF